MEKHRIELGENGFTVFKSFFNEDFMLELGASIDKSYQVCRDMQIKNGISEVTDGTVHHLPGTDDPNYIKLLEIVCKSPLYQFLTDFFSGNFILNTYGGVINLTSKPSYVANVHRDIRFFSGEFPLMINFLIMLDDFTIDNGATYLLAGSHKSTNKPSEKDFFNKSQRAVGKRGDILFFNSNLWHAAGINTSALPRRAITIAFTKPFMKQQMDYPRLIGYDQIKMLDKELQQVLGYFSRIPTNLSEWYQKPENRFYRPDQDKEIKNEY